MKPSCPHLQCLSQWPIVNTFLTDSHGLFFQILLNKEKKEKAEEGNLKNFSGSIHRMKKWQGKGLDSMDAIYSFAQNIRKHDNEKGKKNELIKIFSISDDI